MKNRKDFFLGGFSAIIHSLAVPLFAFVFVVLYKPFGIAELLQMENGSYSFNITMLFCIVLGSVALMRLILFLLRNVMTFSRLVYAIWCVGEVVVASLFVSLYLTLMLEGEVGFFEVVGASAGRLFGVTIFPYAIIWLGLELWAEIAKSEEVADPSSLIKFYDEYHKLRFVIASEAVIFLKSEDNYVQIHYTDRDKSRKFVLRSSMRALEEQMTRQGLVRCHRSYFINPDHVKMVRRESSGVVVAELKQEWLDPVPISRRYQEEISRLF